MKSIRKALLILFAIVFVLIAITGCSSNSKLFSTAPRLILQDSLIEVTPPENFLIGTQTDVSQLGEWINSQNDAEKTEESFISELVWNCISMYAIPQNIEKQESNEMLIMSYESDVSKAVVDLTDAPLENKEKIVSLYEESSTDEMQYLEVELINIGEYDYINYLLKEIDENGEYTLSYTNFTVKNGKNYYFIYQLKNQEMNQEDKNILDNLVASVDYIKESDLPVTSSNDNEEKTINFNFSGFLMVLIPGIFIVVILAVILKKHEKKKANEEQLLDENKDIEKENIEENFVVDGNSSEDLDESKDAQESEEDFVTDENTEETKVIDKNNSDEI